MSSFAPWFRRALAADPARLHFAAHSHHLWPDATYDAHLEAWQDAARLADDKWEHVFGTVWPEAQRHVARELHLPAPSSLVFAPNTHELVARLLSCLPQLPECPRIVTSDAEFHSFDRQVRRLEEEGLVRVVRVPTEPFGTFPARLVKAARRAETDLVFFSHVFFNSGWVVPDLDGLVAELPPEAMVVVDGYHGFCAVPTSLQRVGARAFYLAGGYKYAMAGEGCCFLHVPPVAMELRPRNTGWFAEFGALHGPRDGTVAWAPGGMRFAGATFDPTGLYRLVAALRWRQEVGLTTERVHAHAHALQRQFVEGLEGLPLDPASLVVPLSDANRGQFLAFRTPEAQSIAATLKLHRVVTDARADRLRFGFAPYHGRAEVQLLLERLRLALR